MLLLCQVNTFFSFQYLRVTGINHNPRRQNNFLIILSQVGLNHALPIVEKKLSCAFLWGSIRTNRSFICYIINFSLICNFLCLPKNRSTEMFNMIIYDIESSPFSTNIHKDFYTLALLLDDTIFEWSIMLKRMYI